MRLNDYAGAAIATGLFLMAVIGYRDSVRDDFVAEFNVPRALPAPPPPDPATLPAWPDAPGYGRMALAACRDSVINGSWDLKVFKVTRADSALAVGGVQQILDDSVADDQYDIIIFPNGGVYRTSDVNPGASVDIYNDCVYMSGATAQGDGVAFTRDHPYGAKMRVGGDLRGVNPGADDVLDVVVRDLRLWSDSTPAGITPPFNTDGERIIIDHFSLHGGADQSGGPAWKDATLSFSIVSSIIGNDASGGPTLWLTGGANPPTDSTYRTTIFGTYFAHSSYRMPAYMDRVYAVGDTGLFHHAEYINGLTYNAYSHSRMAQTAGNTHVDWIGWQFKQPTTEGSVNNSWQVIQHRTCDSATGTGNEHQPGSIYVDNIEYYESSSLVMSNWSLYYIPDGAPYEYNCTRGGSVIPDSLKRSTRMNQTADSIVPWSASAVDDSLFNGSLRVQAGAARRLTCGGAFVANRDSTDQNVIDDFADDTGTDSALYKSGGWGGPHMYRDTLLAGTACPDLDDDGLPDDYEKLVMGATDSTGLKADSIAPNMGYFALEMYLDGRDFNASAEGGVEPVPPTWGDGRIAYLVPVVQETVITRDTLGAVVDTFIRLAPDSDSIDSGTRYRAILVASRGSTMILTYDTLTLGAGARDSAAVDSILADMGITYPPYPWSVSVPGEP